MLETKSCDNLQAVCWQAEVEYEKKATWLEQNITFSTSTREIC